jgi:sigma-B regulation protein RsbU (phosphoserine phosphatase)
LIRELSLLRGERAHLVVCSGLYIVKQIVNAHGGTVTVESNEVEGTKLVVKLPRRVPAKS